MEFMDNQNQSVRSFDRHTMSPPMPAEPWQWKLHLLNLAAVVYFMMLSLGSFVIGVFITLPDIYRDDPPATLRNCQLAACCIFVIMMLNYVCFRYYSKLSKLHADACSLPKVSAEEMRLCRTCEVLMPPRAKHCPLCNVCVLKRDHHCFFGGCCVGFHNQRYFIAFCLYGTLGSLYSTIATFSYLRAHYANILSPQCYTFLVPWLMWYWYMGQTDINIVAMVIFSYFCTFTFIACSYFLAVQFFLAARGQTSYEYMKGIRRYRYSLMENIRSVFGPLWFLNLILPLPFLKSEHNGIDWKVVHDFKQN